MGTPAEVYEYPTTAFVAGFVGVSNVLTGERAAALTGSPAAFAVRPEKIRLGPLDTSPRPSHARVDGIVRDVVYLGPHTRYLLSLDLGQDLTVGRAEPRHHLGRGAGRQGPPGAGLVGPGVQPPDPLG